MEQPTPKGLVDRFDGSDNWIDSLSPEVVERLIIGSSDIALFLDKDGIIHDVKLGGVEPAREGYENWRGRAWVDTVTVESRAKVDDLIKRAGAKTPPRFREINHSFNSGSDLPVRYSAVQIGSDGRIMALGRDLRNLSTLQQRLVEAQQAMEREYSRLRFAETRYRMLFQLASEPVVIIDTAKLRIIEANPAAQRHIIIDGSRLVNEPILSAFTPESAARLEIALKAARTSGHSDEVNVEVASTGRIFGVSSSMFRQDSASFLLVRLTPVLVEKATPAGVSVSNRILGVLEQLPDGFVVTDPDLKILELNQAFLDLAQLGSKQQAIGAPLERWLGRPGVDMQLLMSSLADHGAVRNFSTVMRGSFGSTEEVEVSAVPALTGENPSYGFVMRSTGVRIAIDEQRERVLPRSVEHLAELVGRVSLKEMVRETTDVIERLCIEAALELSKDNRGSAAQMLGLSRQSFYSKMRRYGLGDLDSAESELN